MQTATYVETRRDGYRQINAPGRRTLEHRAIVEQTIGRKLEPREEIHHKDRNRTNNDPGNLMIFPSRSAHIAFHRAEREAEYERNGKLCGICGDVKPTTEYYRIKSRNNKLMSKCKTCTNTNRRKGDAASD